MTILVIAPHADDEIIGMGGTIARFNENSLKVYVAVITGHGDGNHPIWPKSKWDEIHRECANASKIVGISEIIYRNLPAACLDTIPAIDINKIISDLILEINPEELYIPFYYDLHKDHSAISYAVNVACRPYKDSVSRLKRVLAYETLSETHLSYLSQDFHPNVFINITETMEKKIKALRCYKSQISENNGPRSIKALKALATLRGAHINCDSAEAFMLLGEYKR